MRTWEVHAERGYYQLSQSRPPFVTAYEKDRLTWQRRDRTIVFTLTALATCLAGLAFRLAI